MPIRDRSSSAPARHAHLAVLFALLIGLAPGCAVKLDYADPRADEASPAGSERPSSGSSEMPSTRLETWFVDGEVDVVSVVELENDPFEDPVTVSPLDELGEITPELSPDELERERDLVAHQAPTFDIPIDVNDRVLAWVELYSHGLKPWFEQGLTRSGRYLPMFRQIFADEGLPQDLVYMAAVESGYKTGAYSRAHARGIFQFISATGRRYGLRVDYWVDERSDPEKSARAAAAYMKDLYEEFGDWYLALAAYNAGEGKIRRAIARTGSRDFWQLAKTRYLRRETRNHVPAILAATLLSKEPAKYGLRYEPEEPLLYDSISVDGAVDLRVLARCAETDVATLTELNPALRRYQTPPDGSTDVRVPRGMGSLTAAALKQVPRNERVLYGRHVVRRGDTLYDIARAYGVTVGSIQQANRMGRRTLIRERQVLRIPTNASTQYGDVPLPDGGGEVLVYRVRRGDTLSGIARRYQTTPNTIAATNAISVNQLLQIGQRLRIVRGARSASEASRIAQGSGEARSNGSKVHTVRRGDSLWRIARQYDTSVDRLCSLNQISPKAVIRPGVQLKVGQ